MSPPPNERPIIVVKRHKRRSHAHHGGAWKVAYADFVTAMMAFFLVMWLVTAVSKDQRAAIFDYFKNPSMEPGKSSKPAPGQMGPGGASTSPINLHGGLDSMRSQITPIRDIKPQSVEPLKPAASPDAQAQSQPVSEEEKKKIEQLTLQAQQEAEHKKLESLMEELRKAIDESQALKPYKDQLLLDIMPEGVRIQIVDAQNRPMFDVGSARLRDYTVAILKELAKYLATVSNRISISGHTDIRPYPGGSGGYSNWELSADRANAARRALIVGGLPDDKIALVVGLASSVLFDKVHPDNPINRRISIIVMTKQAERDALKTDAASEEATPPVEPVAAPSAAPAPSAVAPPPAAGAAPAT